MSYYSGGNGGRNPDFFFDAACYKSTKSVASTFISFVKISFEGKRQEGRKNIIISRVYVYGKIGSFACELGIPFSLPRPESPYLVFWAGPRPKGGGRNRALLYTG